MHWLSFKHLFFLRPTHGFIDGKTETDKSEGGNDGESEVLDGREDGFLDLDEEGFSLICEDGESEALDGIEDGFLDLVEEGISLICEDGVEEGTRDGDKELLLIGGKVGDEVGDRDAVTTGLLVGTDGIGVAGGSEGGDGMLGNDVRSENVVRPCVEGYQ